MRRGVRALAGAVVVLAAIGVSSSVAEAHVTIDTMGEVTQGSFAKLGFSVPNERDDAGTVALRVQLPTDHPLAYVSVQPMPGWDIVTTTRTLDTPADGEGGSITDVVDTITWTATGDTRIEPGQFEMFWISAGQMPTDVTELAFPAVQTYDSGEEVAWIDSAAGGAEPEHPAPSVALVPADEGGATVSGDDGTDPLAVVALVIAVVGLVAAVAALALARRPRPDPA